jgi:hypothetical protein
VEAQVFFAVPYSTVSGSRASKPHWHKLGDRSQGYRRPLPAFRRMMSFTHSACRSFSCTFCIFVGCIAFGCTHRQSQSLDESTCAYGAVVSFTYTQEYRTSKRVQPWDSQARAAGKAVARTKRTKHHRSAYLISTYRFPYAVDVKSRYTDS